MIAGFPYFVSLDAEEVKHLRKSGGWFLALGIILILLGTLAISYPFLGTLAAVTFFGFMLLCAAGAEVASALWARRWGGFVLHLLMGLLYLFVGAFFLERPTETAAAFTLMLAVIFLTSGLFRVVVALTQRFSGWGWTILSGLVGIVLGIMIWRQWPATAYWVIGTFVGIEMLFNGVSWVMLGMAMRSLPKEETPPPA